MGFVTDLWNLNRPAMRVVQLRYSQYISVDLYNSFLLTNHALFGMTFSFCFNVGYANGTISPLREGLPNQSLMVLSTNGLFIFPVALLMIFFFDLPLLMKFVRYFRLIIS